MGKLKQVLALCCLVFFYTTTTVHASIKQFSVALSPTTILAKTSSPSPTKVYQARITQGKTSDLKTAILWHAPPYKSLSKKLNPSEEVLLDEEAMQILLNAATEMNEDLMKAKNIISKKEPLLFRVGQLISSSLDMEENLSLTNFVFNNRGKDAAQESVNKVSSYIYHNYQELKSSYQVTYARDTKLIERYSRARTKLELISGVNAVAHIETLLNGGRV